MVLFGAVFAGIIAANLVALILHRYNVGLLGNILAGAGAGLGFWLLGDPQGFWLANAGGALVGTLAQLLAGGIKSLRSK